MSESLPDLRKPTDPRVESAAAWLYQRMMRERGLPDKTWKDCPDHYKMPFKDGWRDEARELLAAIDGEST